MNKPLFGVTWFGWFSQEAADREQNGKKACKVFDYVNDTGEVVKVTGVTFDGTGKGYQWPDKVPLGLLREKL